MTNVIAMIPLARGMQEVELQLWVKEKCLVFGTSVRVAEFSHLNEPVCEAFVAFGEPVIQVQKTKLDSESAIVLAAAIDAGLEWCEAERRRR